MRVITPGENASVEAIARLKKITRPKNISCRAAACLPNEEAF